MHWQGFLEHIKIIGISNVEITHAFSAHRNLVARCIKDYGIIIPEFANHSNDEIKVIPNDTF